MTHHVLFLDRDNESRLELRANGQNLTAEQYEAITRVLIELRLGGRADERLDLDSQVTAGLFTWSGDLRLVVIEGSLLAGIPVPAGKHKGRVIAFSPDQPEGIVFADFKDYTMEVRT